MSKMMRTALACTAIAFIAVTAAYAGMWWMTVQHPQDFPNNPATDRGYRMLQAYWMTFGIRLMMLGVVAWIPGLLLYASAGLGRRAPFLHGTGLWCTMLHFILGGYVLWLFLSHF